MTITRMALLAALLVPAIIVVILLLCLAGLPVMVDCVTVRGPITPSGFARYKVLAAVVVQPLHA